MSRSSIARSARSGWSVPRDDRAFLSKAREALERVASDAERAERRAHALRPRAAAGGRDRRRRAHAAAGDDALPGRAGGVSLYAIDRRKAESPRGGATGAHRLRRAASTTTEFVSRASRIAALSLRLNDRDRGRMADQAAAASPNDLRLSRRSPTRRCGTGDRDAAQATIANGLEKDPEERGASRARAPRGLNSLTSSVGDPESRHELRQPLPRDAELVRPRPVAAAPHQRGPDEPLFERAPRLIERPRSRRGLAEQRRQRRRRHDAALRSFAPPARPARSAARARCPANRSAPARPSSARRGVARLPTLRGRSRQK